MNGWNNTIYSWNIDSFYFTAFLFYTFINKK